MNHLHLLRLLMVLVISGCVGISHGPGERHADAPQGRIHNMSREGISKLVSTWKLISFHS